MSKITAKRTTNLGIQITQENEASIISGTVEANLLLMILEKLEEIRIEQINTQSELEQMRKDQEELHTRLHIIRSNQK